MTITLRVISIIVLITLSSAFSPTQDAELATTSFSTHQSPSPSDEDKVYSSKEVTVKAIIKSRPEARYTPTTIDECPEKGSALIRMILHKSGKVKDVKLSRGMSCKFDSLAAMAARRIKFVPAQKDGVRVSQYFMVEYAYKIY